MDGELKKINVELVFRFPYSKYFECNKSIVTLPFGCTVNNAINLYIKQQGNMDILQKNNLILLGDLKALFALEDVVVTKNHILKDGDELHVLSALIGG